MAKSEEKRRPVIGIDQNTGVLDEKIESILEFDFRRVGSPYVGNSPQMVEIDNNFEISFFILAEDDYQVI